ncbi:NAD-binding protein [Cytobacillus spongiae]|uniref:potassium channel family protein n=1 Tax=Cytobacillus spongiae TaxID=2901381 RepID=UPI001F276D22|nr:NAD-binding protein [Cytobacillus spongiae]
MRIYRHLITALVCMLLTIIVGTIGFIIFENLSLFDSLWLTLITVLTVGYGDVIPRTDNGKTFAMVIIPIGVGIVTYAIGAFTSMMIEGEFSKTVGRRRMNKKISELQNHIIVCGMGRVGEQVVNELLHKKTPVVIIEKDESAIKASGLHHLYYLIGDATEDQFLIEAGIDRASGLVATLPEDADNVFISLTARGLNQDIRIVARAERPQSEEKLRRAGANKVINPSSIGGNQMVMSILKPVSVEYVDMMLHTGKQEFGVEEMKIVEGSKLIGKTIVENQIRTSYGVTIVAILRDETLISNPSPDETFQLHDMIIVFGSSEQLEWFEVATRPQV